MWSTIRAPKHILSPVLGSVYPIEWWHCAYSRVSYRTTGVASKSKRADPSAIEAAREPDSDAHKGPASSGTARGLRNGGVRMAFNARPALKGMFPQPAPSALSSSFDVLPPTSAGQTALSIRRCEGPRSRRVRNSVPRPKEIRLVLVCHEEAGTRAAGAEGARGSTE